MSVKFKFLAVRSRAKMVDCARILKISQVIVAIARKRIILEVIAKHISSVWVRLVRMAVFVRIARILRVILAIVELVVIILEKIVILLFSVEVSLAITGFVLTAKTTRHTVMV